MEKEQRRDMNELVELLEKRVEDFERLLENADTATDRLAELLSAQRKEGRQLKDYLLDTRRTLDKAKIAALGSFPSEGCRKAEGCTCGKGNAPEAQQ
jgi:hypothetical protein